MFTAMHEAQMHMLLWLWLAGCVGAVIVWVYEK